MPLQVQARFRFNPVDRNPPSGCLFENRIAGSGGSDHVEARSPAIVLRNRQPRIDFRERVWLV